MTPLQPPVPGPEQPRKSPEETPMLPPTEEVGVPEHNINVLSPIDKTEAPEHNIQTIRPTLSGDTPPDQPSAEDIRAARLDELRALEASGQVVARKGTAQELGDRAIERATEAKQTGIPVKVRESSVSDTPVFH